MSSVIRSPSSALRIGTRKSPLALAQAGGVARLLPGAELVPMQTSGDRFFGQPLADIGGKGLFTKELDEALLEGRIDLAVHSAKDLPTRLPPGLILACVPLREDPRDVLIGGATSLAELPAGALMGTASLRRGAQALHVRPDLRLVSLRGNVQTRLAKIASGEAQATLLALAGLKRLNLQPLPGAILSTAEMLPAVAQGALAIVCREADEALRERLAAFDHAESHAAILCERAMLRVLDGSCRTPIAGLAERREEGLCLRGLLLTPDGATCYRAEATATFSDAEKMGSEVGQMLFRRKV